MQSMYKIYISAHNVSMYLNSTIQQDRAINKQIHDTLRKIESEESKCSLEACIAQTLTDNYTRQPERKG